MALLDELDDWDAACAILGDLDYEKQYIAIRALLRRQGKADVDLKKELEEIEEFARRTTGRANERAVEDYGASFYESIFQSAAHSMAAVGMLAPFLESLFMQAFSTIRDQEYLKGAIVSGHARWAMSADLHWDPHFSAPRTRGLSAGIVELADAIGLGRHLPPSLQPIIAALFAYRNKMFHFGFEWPVEERRLFAGRIVSEQWPPGWFGRASTGGEPWVFFLSDEYVKHCLTSIEAVLRGFGAFVRERVNDGVKPDASPWNVS